MRTRRSIIRPGIFSVQATADSRRMEFDYKNEVLVSNQIPVDFVFIGDSITELWEISAYFSGKGRLIINRGIGGDASEYVLKRFEADVIQLKPRYAVLMIGVNDTWKIDDNPWQRTCGQAIEDAERELLGNIGAIIELANSRRQNLILCSILPTNLPLNAKNAERNALIRRVNGKLEGMANTGGIIYVDYHCGVVGSDGLTLADWISDDGVHPHVLGYNIMADILKQTLAEKGVEI